MALEHALLVSLRERPATGIELTRRFDRSIGFFWSATHQQIYRVLARMESDRWVRSAAPGGRGGQRRYQVTTAGERALADWLATPTKEPTTRSDLAVKLRGASYGDRATVLRDLERHLHEHRNRLTAYEQMRERQYPEPDVLDGQALDQYLVLRGGMLQEQFWITWISEYLEAHR